jgi:hypothetical protein
MTEKWSFRAGPRQTPYSVSSFRQGATKNNNNNNNNNMAADTNGGLQAQKKIKLDNTNGGGDGDKTHLSTFQGFQVTSVLNDRPNEKVVFLHGRFKDRDDDAVVILEKTAFNKDNLSDVLCEDTRLNQTLHNDIYSTYEGFPKPELNGNLIEYP